MNKTTFSKFLIRSVGVVVALGAIISFGSVAQASHTWGNYHWARTVNPSTLKLGDNVGTTWDSYLNMASVDWSQSSVLDTTVVAGGTNPRNCRPTNGRVETCSRTYGFNGWLGVASVWVEGDHITKGTVKMNDSYFNTQTYNTPQWRSLVMCQEIGHTFGLDHQDENFDNPNLGTCMDYTNNPSGPPSNDHPNTHDYEQLETIYGHLDSITTIGQLISQPRRNSAADSEDWGKAIRKDSKGKASLFERDLGRNEKLFTFVVWAE